MVDTRAPSERPNVPSLRRQRTSTGEGRLAAPASSDDGPPPPSRNDAASAPSEAESLRKMGKIVNQLLGRADSVPFRDPVNWRELRLHDYPKIIKKMMDLGTVKRKLERGKYDTAEDCADDVRLVWSNCRTYNADGSDFYLLAESFGRRFEDRYRKIAAARSSSQGGAPNASASAAHAAAPVSSSRRDPPQRERSPTKSKASARSTSPTPPKGAGVTPVQSSRDSLAGRADGTSLASPGLTGGAGRRSSAPGAIEHPDGGASTTIPLEVRTRFAARLQRLAGIELGHVLQILELRCPEALEDPAKEPPMRNNRNCAWEEYDGGCELEIDVDAIPPTTFHELDKYVKEKVRNSRISGLWNGEPVAENVDRGPAETGGAKSAAVSSEKKKKRKHKG